jgi:hypothetical protein
MNITANESFFFQTANLTYINPEVFYRFQILRNRWLQQELRDWNTKHIKLIFVEGWKKGETSEK